MVAIEKVPFESLSTKVASFTYFINDIIDVFGSNWLKNLWRGKFADWLKKKKKVLFNCKYKISFQPDECAKPTCSVTCLNNIWLLKCTFVVVYLLILLVS